MKRKVAFWLLFLVLAYPLRAQENAVVLSDESIFSMRTLSDGTLQVDRRVMVLNKEGQVEGSLMIYIGKNERLGSFKGSVSPVVAMSGRKSAEIKIRREDLTSHSPGDALAEDGMFIGYVPSAGYPYIVHYTYTVQYRKGFAVFPAWMPVRTEKTSLVHGSYLVRFPEGTDIRYQSTAMNPPEITETSCKWEIKDYGGYVNEHLMPERKKLVPSVLSSPSEFMFDGVSGSQNSWKELAQWQEKLLQGQDDLSESVQEEVERLTSSCPSRLDKIRALYRYLGQRSRYVSIQLGIGGFRPFPASTVERTGFGDCKALTNYFASLLRRSGISSVYTVLNTEEERLPQGYPSFGQTNHVMLSVPLPEYGDTLFVECTHPSLPLGYRHQGIAGHDVLLIGESGSPLARIGALPDSLNCREIRSDITLHTDGTAGMSVSALYSSYAIESVVALREADAKKQQQVLLSGMAIHPRGFRVTRMWDNFDSYDGPGWCPEACVDFQMDTQSFGRTSGDRIFVPVNATSRKLFIQREKRANDLEVRHGMVIRDRSVIHIPDGYVVEAAPESVDVESQWGHFTSSIVCGEREIIVEQCLRIKPCRTPASEYEDYRMFARTVNRLYSGSIVLKSCSEMVR